LKLTILGNNSAIPAYGRHPTAQILQIHQTSILIDCGEGTWMQMQRFGVRSKNLKYIFISHLHGDHYFGLPGLLTSLSLQGREKPLTLFAPPGLRAILEQIFSVADTQLSYALHIQEWNPSGEILFENDEFLLRNFPTQHRIICSGLVVEKKEGLRHLQIEACRQSEVPQSEYLKLKKGADFITKKGERISNVELTTSATPAKVYAYSADTIFNQASVPHIKNADLLYYESTFCEADKDKASKRFHSTAKQAAQIAQLANVKKLMLGHFSSRYQELEIFQQEAQSVFRNSEVSIEGVSYEID